MKKSNVEALTERFSNSFKGVEIKRIPKVGGGWSYGVGSDRYGGKILYVSPDLSWFMGDEMCGFAKLDTRKNSCHYGQYVHATWPSLDTLNNGNAYVERLINHPEIFDNNNAFKAVYKSLKFVKTNHCRGCISHNVRWVSDEPQKTELDPSF